MTTPSSYAAVRSNLDAILADPSTTFDLPAIEKLKLEITEKTDPRVAAALLTQISQILPVLQYDPTPVTSLGIRVTTFLKFSDLQAVDPSVNLLAGIRAPSPPINLLALSLLAKANRSPSDAAIVAGDSDLVATLVELWLSTANTEVAQAALDVLWSLLEVDHVDNETVVGAPQNIASGQGLLWRRLFTDKNVYGILFSICSLTNTEAIPKLSKREKSVAQGRLLDFIVKAGTLRWDLISDSHIPEVDSEYQSSSLLDFAVCHMIDTTDVLMHMTLLNFFRELIQIDAPRLADVSSSNYQASTFSSPALDFLFRRTLHQRVLGFYLDSSKLDSIDLTFLASPIMAYVAQYARLYPNHLLQSPRDLLDKILSRILKALDIPSAQWAHGEVPLGDLTILGSLPRIMLVEASRRSLNPLQVIPSNPPNKDCYQTLARVFHGPPLSSDTPAAVSDTPTDAYKESVAARILYFTYLNEHANLWQNVVAAADIVAMQGVALSAIGLIRAVVVANWKTLSTEDAQQTSASAFKLPSEDDLNRQASTGPGALPTSGSWAILTPPALTTVLPYLFKPPLSYSNFVAGGAGDPESTVWKLATAKYDVLIDLHRVLKNSTAQVEGFEDIVSTLEQRIRDGPQGPANQVGSRVEALEM